MAKRKVLFINYFLFLGGGEKLLIELIDFCLKNNIEPEVLITDINFPGDNQKEEYYDEYLKKKGVKIYRVPVFYKTRRREILKFKYWRFKLKYSGLFYNSVHIINFNLADRIYDIVRNEKRYFWHIINKIQWESGYPYRQELVGNPKDTIITVNRYQEEEIQEYFTDIRCKIVAFRLF